MRNLLILLLLYLFLPISVFATEYYVATTGSDSNPGTISQPWATWQYAFNKLKAGDILYVRGGTYTKLLGTSGSNAFGVRVQSINGSSSSHITVSAYPGEVPILDGSSLTLTTGSNIGLALYSCSYWDFTGINCTNFKQASDNVYEATGWYESDVIHITHTQCTDYHCGDGFVLKGSHDDIHYTNCDSYENADRYIDPTDQGGKPGGLANGFYATPGTGNHIYYTGCRAWNNTDDGWDTFNSYGGYIEITNCWSFDNGWYLNTVGDGSGFKMGIINGPVESGMQRTLKNCLAFGNLGPGYDQNSGSSGTIVQIGLYNCTSANNESGTFAFYYDNKAIIRNCVSYNEPLGDIGKSSTIDHNSWQNGMSATTADFLGTNTAEATAPRKADGSLPDINFLHLASTSKLIDAGTNVGLPYNGNAPDLGAFEAGTGSAVVVPSYTSSAVSGTTPSILEMTYNMTLANVIPAASAFKVMVNSTARTVNSVAISGTKVQLTLATAVVTGDVVTVSYTQPSSNPLQASGGGQAASIGAQAVTNNVNAVNPVYASSVVANATPTVLEMTYNMTLANVVPAASAFKVMVNSSARTVNSVAISGTKVQLTLATTVVYGDIVTASYTQPSSNPLQASGGGQAASIGAQAVTNNVNAVNPVYASSVVANATPTVLEMTYNMTLANVVPAASAFKVMVNSSARTVNSVAISGTKVQLTLVAPVVYGDIVTAAYTQPSSNPLQAPTGGKAATIGAQAVTNNVNAVNPVYASSVVANATPTVLEMTYNMTLANVVPAASAFKVMVNSSARTVNSVAISGTKVQLTLATTVVYGDIVTASYTQPSSNPLQASGGGQAASIGAQAVTNNVNAVIPVYASSVVANATPSVLEMTYNMTLANVVPAASAFKVMVNSSARTVNSIAISGTKVQLTLATPVVYGDIVTAAYTQPSSNPLQASTGGKAATIGAKAVTNNVNAVNPLYVSSAVANATPSELEMTYNMALANVVPAASAFKVMVNSTARIVNSVVISGTSVQITLESRIFSGDAVTVSYSKPLSNPIQSGSGAAVASFSSQPVSNNCLNIAPTSVITSPSVNSTFSASSDITIAANAADIDGAINSVEFYNGSTKIGSSSFAPYSVDWPNVQAGNYTLTAIATDDKNSKTTSSAVTISVLSNIHVPNKHPFVRILNPRKGNTYENLSSIEIDATASDDDGTISKLEFFNGDTSLIEMTSAPYIFTWKDVPAGTYTITAVATDNQDDTTISSPVEFVVGISVKYDANSDIINLYPNPNDGHFSIDILSPLQSDKSEIVITDLAGKQIYSGPIKKEEMSKEFDLSGASSGIYVMMVRDKQILVTKKFIKN